MRQACLAYSRIITIILHSKYSTTKQKFQLKKQRRPMNYTPFVRKVFYYTYLTNGVLYPCRPYSARTLPKNSATPTISYRGNFTTGTGTERIHKRIWTALSSVLFWGVFNFFRDFRNRFSQYLLRTFSAKQTTSFSSSRVPSSRMAVPLIFPKT